MSESLRLGIAQINPTVGDLEGNSANILAYMEKAGRQGVDLLVFPELALTGYPPEDLLLKTQFVKDNRDYLYMLVDKAARFTPAVIGFVDSDSAGLYNAAALVAQGKLQQVYQKQVLPNYGVFDEKRYFSPGKNHKIFVLNSHPIAVNICEDIWDNLGPYIGQIHSAGAELLLVINASPFHAGKWRERYDLLKRRSEENRVIIAYVNLVGGQDELVFDGHSLVFGPDGELLGQARTFEEDLLVLDIDFAPVKRLRQEVDFQEKKRDTGGRDFQQVVIECPCHEKPDCPPALLSPPFLDHKDEIYRALILGTRDYVRKNGFQKVVIGLSGGIDSALTAVIATDALGAECVETVFMPSDYSSKQSEEDARLLSENLGLGWRVIPIQPIFEVFLETLNPYFDNLPPDATEENMQARIRGKILMALSNKFGWLVLTTGNKSEMSVGYATLYGDMAGGFAVIKDIYKGLVYELSHYRNLQGAKPVIPERILTKEPSAELRPDQLDSDTLPPYPELDSILKLYVEEDKSLEEIVKAGCDRRTAQQVLKMVDRNEYKRRQAPPGIRITPKAFGKDRRLPITSRFRWESKSSEGA